MNVEQIASGLSEQQKTTLTQDMRNVNWPMWLKVQRPDLLEYHENSFGSWINLTATGLAVRNHLLAHPITEQGDR